MPTPLRCDFVIEQTLGHVTHTKNLRAIVPTFDDVEPRFFPVEFDAPGPRIPGGGNWTVRAGLEARRQVRTAWEPGHRPDAMFVHTQVPAVGMVRYVRSVPTIVSFDATPRQYDSLGEFYRHETHPAPIEHLKHLANRRAVRSAAHIVTWSRWTRQAVIDEYGVSPDSVTAVAPGVDLEPWARSGQRASETAGPVRLLFVGGDLRRKGGDTLIEAVRSLRADPDVPDIELHLVTPATVEPEPGVVVHPGLTANSPELIEQYHHADIFCLPTLGDCLPMVLAEAAAAGLPLVSTDVGAISEVVVDGETGRLVAPDDVQGLSLALRDLIVAPERRRACGQAARARAERDHDARANARTLVELMRMIATGGDGGDGRRRRGD